MDKITKGMLDYVWKSCSPYHAVNNLITELDKKGFIRLEEADAWKLKAGGRYYVTRNGSAIISFKVPGKDYKGFLMTASHSDSPSFKIKENPELRRMDAYVSLNVEGYGGMLDGPWFDRPLSVAGRVYVKGRGSSINMKLVNVDKDLVMMPSLAIHMNREANKGYSFNAQKDMIPLYGSADAPAFMETIAEVAGVKASSILGSDLFLYNRVAPSVWGASSEYISASRLDDLECVYTTFRGFMEAENDKYVCLHCVFDNEEVGSGTRQGAASTFLKDTLIRIGDSMGRSSEDYYRSIAGSFMLSADNAHAVHPNYSDKADPVNRPFMNKGIVIKYNANQRYTTDGASEAVLKYILNKAGIPYQAFTNRSDMPGGSTLGNISSTQIPVRTVDIGLAQLAMHSPYETAGALDPSFMARGAEAFYRSDVSLRTQL
ncbi:M18 family aminopeptidase [Butyrivibrio sp. MC2013]|uniref:M18 family aminopeptidase n=1 Tax=Butyrivibrio sp. MC2013 TaxID=1280686 RepID=UPI00041D7BB9|nr:M18 family aminopeptidase [Butyrivibrio sp. MC2013]